jgi:hypothetical protein
MRSLGRRVDLVGLERSSPSRTEVVGVGETGGEWTASDGGHVAYVESIDKNGTIVISQMGVGAAPSGDYTMALVYDPESHISFTIYRRESRILDTTVTLACVSVAGTFGDGASRLPRSRPRPARAASRRMPPGSAHSQ